MFYTTNCGLYAHENEWQNIVKYMHNIWRYGNTRNIRVQKLNNETSRRARVKYSQWNEFHSWWSAFCWYWNVVQLLLLLVYIFFFKWITDPELGTDMDIWFLWFFMQKSNLQCTSFLFSGKAQWTLRLNTKYWRHEIVSEYLWLNLGKLSHALVFRMHLINWFELYFSTIC